MQIIGTVFIKTPPPHTGRLLLSLDTSRANFGDVYISVFQKCIIENSPKGKNYIPFDFDLKYSHHLSPPSIIFYKHQERYVYMLKSYQDLQKLRDILKSKLNQRGFHEQFKPKKKIGKGNFASVYLAEKAEDNKNYAVKAFSKQAAYSEDKGKECLILQIEVMRSLANSNCMRLFEVFQSENSLYVVVELLEGGQLHDKIKAKNKFKSFQIKIIIQSILNGLKEMHSKKIMHRDLKPQNLIFRSSDSMDCVIADFGLAEFCDAEEYLFVRCGTPGFVAPEVINIKDMKTKYDTVCDIFSLGLIFHILLLGVSAFPGKNYNQVLAQNRASNFQFNKQEYKMMDPLAFDLLSKMLRKQPIERITAVEALNHPYFRDIIQNNQISKMVPELIQNKCNSPPINYTIQNQSIFPKDSCVELRMGKENVFTGKVGTITSTGLTVNSMGQSIQYHHSPKPSKFRATNK